MSYLLRDIDDYLSDNTNFIVNYNEDIYNNHLRYYDKINNHNSFYIGFDEFAKEEDGDHIYISGYINNDEIFKEKDIYSLEDFIRSIEKFNFL